MNDRTYTTADGATIRPGDSFFAVERFTDAIRVKRVGTGRVVCLTNIPCVGGSSCEPGLAFADKAAVVRFLIARHEKSYGDAQDAIRRAKAQMKRDLKALAKLRMECLNAALSQEGAAHAR